MSCNGGVPPCLVCESRGLGPDVGCVDLATRIKKTVMTCGNNFRFDAQRGGPPRATSPSVSYRFRTKQIFVTEGENLHGGCNGGSKICARKAIFLLREQARGGGARARSRGDCLWGHRNPVSQSHVHVHVSILLRQYQLVQLSEVQICNSDGSICWLGAVGVGRSGVRQRRAAELPCTAAWVNMKCSTQVLCLYV